MATTTDAKSGLTAERLREILDYDADTGIFRWRCSSGQRIKPGDIAGRLNNAGYWQIGINRRMYYAHRLAWLHIFGDWPQEEIDHVDTVRHNNKIANLRLASRPQNGANQLRHRDNRSGFKGVSFHKQDKRWYARIGFNGRNINLGRFDTPEEAHAAYQAAADTLFGEFANDGVR